MYTFASPTILYKTLLTYLDRIFLKARRESVFMVWYDLLKDYDKVKLNKLIKLSEIYRFCTSIMLVF